MTKTTNYEISKKLAEIGFKADCSYFYFHSDNNDCEANSLEKYGFDKISQCDIEDKYYPAYDLETLLDALPEINKQLPLLCFSGITYLDPVNIGLSRNKNESLADTAGRLIILLHEKNLIKF
ncbi:MAG: hypothetical protein RL027_599 [Pseudomonadota bacterium]|jgi:hypothetical protein